MALWGLANAASQGLMTRRVGADEQGQLQGANQSLQGIADMIGPGLFTLSFACAIGRSRVSIAGHAVRARGVAAARRARRLRGG